MTSASGETSFSEDEVHAFAHKLEAWADVLPPSEQAMLRTLIAHAGGVPEVEGHVLPGGPLSAPIAPGIIAVLGRSPLGGLSNDTFTRGGLSNNTIGGRFAQPGQ